jgi:hypothetical protein
MRRKPATSATFIDHCKYQVVGLTEDQAQGMILPENWRTLARTFTTFPTYDKADEAAEKRSKLNDNQPFAVVDRDTALITSVVRGMPSGNTSVTIHLVA